MTNQSTNHISLTVEDDGEVMISAAGVVGWLRELAEQYGSGGCGGSASMQRGAQEALTITADDLQEAYIDVAADRLTDTWWRS